MGGEDQWNSEGIISFQCRRLQKCTLVVTEIRPDSWAWDTASLQRPPSQRPPIKLVAGKTRASKQSQAPLLDSGGSIPGNDDVNLAVQGEESEDVGPGLEHHAGFGRDLDRLERILDDLVENIERVPAEL